MALLRIVPLCVVALGCRPTNVVSALSSRASPTPAFEHADAPLKVRVDATSAHLPLSVAGSNIVYTDVDHALEQSIRTALAVAPGRSAIAAGRQRELLVEIVEAQAELPNGRLVVRMIVRATLRENAGNAYVAQTHAR